MQAAGLTANALDERTASNLPLRRTASGSTAPANETWYEFGDALSAGLRAAATTPLRTTDPGAVESLLTSAPEVSPGAIRDEVKAAKEQAPAKPLPRKAEELQLPVSGLQGALPSEGLLSSAWVPAAAAPSANSLTMTSSETREVDPLSRTFADPKSPATKSLDTNPTDSESPLPAKTSRARPASSVAKETVSSGDHSMAALVSLVGPSAGLSADEGGVAARQVGGRVGLAGVAAKLISGTAGVGIASLPSSQLSPAQTPAQVSTRERLAVVGTSDAGVELPSIGIDSATPLSSPLRESSKSSALAGDATAAPRAGAVNGPAIEGQSPVTQGDSGSDSRSAMSQGSTSLAAGVGDSSVASGALSADTGPLNDSSRNDSASLKMARAADTFRLATREGKALPPGTVERVATPGRGLAAGAEDSTHSLSGDLAGADGFAKSAARESSSEESSHPATVLSRDSLGAMDSAAATRPLQGSAHAVEVGVNDPSHGWIEVRAQGVRGQVTASLTAATPEAHAALHEALPGMTAYLAQREIGLRSLTVDGGGRETAAHTGGDAGSPGGDSGAGGEPHSQSGSQAGQDVQKSSRERADGDTSGGNKPVLSTDGLLQDIGGGRAGDGMVSSHRISVRA